MRQVTAHVCLSPCLMSEILKNQGHSTRLVSTPRPHRQPPSASASLSSPCRVCGWIFSIGVPSGVLRDKLTRIDALSFSQYALVRSAFASNLSRFRNSRETVASGPGCWILDFSGGSSITPPDGHLHMASSCDIPVSCGNVLSLKVEMEQRRLGD